MEHREETELDLHQLFAILKRRLWMIVAIPLVAIVSAWSVSSFVQEPVYSASATLWVIKDGSDGLNYNDLLLSRNLTQTYAEVAKSRAVLAEVIDALQLDGVTVEGLQKRLTVAPVRDTEVMRVTVEDHDPVMAAKIANQVGETFQKQISSYMKVENVVMVDPPMVPQKPVKPRVKRNCVSAGVLGFVVAVGFVLMLELLDTSIKTQDDVVRHVGLPVLASVPVIDTVRQSPPKRSRIKLRRKDAVGVRK